MTTNRKWRSLILIKWGFFLIYSLFFIALLFGVHDDRPSTPTEQLFIWSSFGLVALWLAVKGTLLYRIRRAAAVAREYHPNIERGVLSHLRSTFYFQILITIVWVGICTRILPRPGDFLPLGIAMGFACALLTGAILSIWIVVENVLFSLLGLRRNIIILAVETVIVATWIIATFLPDDV